MIDLNNIRNIYFIGIGGIGMSALARYFSFHKKRVSGYDKTTTALTRRLEEEGIPVHYTDDPELAPHDAELIVYTPAIPSDHRELQYYKNNNYQICKRSDVLGAITESSFNICIAGTHGKTTISTMVAHILRHSGYGCNAFLGGIATNYNSNFWSSERNTCVIEADEYDRSFLKLNPDIAVISAMDADHLDIYGTETAMQDAFIDFSGKLKKDGVLFAATGLKRSQELKAPRIIFYSGTDTTADIYTQNINMVNGYYLFDVMTPQGLVDDIALNMGGHHNVENASVAIAIAKSLDIETEAIRSAIEDFMGVKRRFEYIIKKKDLVYIDDYAHHPEELSALISSALNLFGGLKCTVIFQPHLFTRTRDLAEEFAVSLDAADEVLLLPVYPARELPIKGVTSELIKNKMKNPNCRVIEKEGLTEYLQNVTLAREGKKKNLLITAGAGDIDMLTEPIRKILNAME